MRNGSDRESNPRRGPWGVVNGARKKKGLSHFIFQLQILPHMPSNSIKCKGNLGKIIPVALKYLIYAMQNVI
jgi:hypothetical protein